MLMFSDFLSGLSDRLHGPMHLRLFLQPLMASVFALRDGKKDALEGKSPYFWGLFTEPEHRHERLQSGWKSIGKIFIVAVILDLVFQVLAFHELRLGGGAIWAGIVLALLPYTLLRGPFKRLFSHKLAAKDEPQTRSRAA